MLYTNKDEDWNFDLEIQERKKRIDFLKSQKLKKSKEDSNIVSEIKKNVKNSSNNDDDGEEEE